MPLSTSLQPCRGTASSGIVKAKVKLQREQSVSCSSGQLLRVRLAMQPVMLPAGIYGDEFGHVLWQAVQPFVSTCAPLISAPLTGMSWSVRAAQQSAAEQRVPGEAGRLRTGAQRGAAGGGRRAQPHPDRLRGHALVPRARDPTGLHQVHLRRRHVVQRCDADDNWRASPL